ncbi:MAG: radical SAM protein, partial [Deltaproteobacteria bacterium]
MAREPETQVEIQLGHMCNNRCVFCVSGQRTALREAFPLAPGPIRERIQAAYAAGNRKITLLGGEPTLQPAFLDIVRYCVALGFEDIVIFTNGVKTARASFIDEVLATGGRFTWRISIQGATKESHERTTKRPGSFGRILRSLGHLRERGQRITVNMCVVQSNYRDVDRFPELLLPYGVEQLHLDMVRPRDAGRRTEREFAQMIPRYSDLVEPLTRMVEGFPASFDVNVGNLPFCIAPELIHRIHHDGEKTFTIAIDRDDRLSLPWDKYEDKRSDKFHPEACDGCLMRSRCNGVFERYAQLYGTGELHALDEAALRRADPAFALLPVHLQAHLGRCDLASLGAVRIEESADDELSLEALGLSLRLRPPQDTGIAATERFSLHLARPLRGNEEVRALLRIWSVLSDGLEVWHPPGPDAWRPLPRLAGRIHRLRRAAPFGALRWKRARLRDGSFVAEFSGASNTAVEFWLGW